MMAQVSMRVPAGFRVDSRRWAVMAACPSTHSRLSRTGLPARARTTRFGAAWSLLCVGGNGRRRRCQVGYRVGRSRGGVSQRPACGGIRGERALVPSRSKKLGRQSSVADARPDTQTRSIGVGWRRYRNGRSLTGAAPDRHGSSRRAWTFLSRCDRLPSSDRWVPTVAGEGGLHATTALAAAFASQ